MIHLMRAVLLLLVLVIAGTSGLLIARHETREVGWITLAGALFLMLTFVATTIKEKP